MHEPDYFDINLAKQICQIKKIANGLIESTTDP